MAGDKVYIDLLNKLLTIEHVGNTLYKALISKVRNENMRIVYEKLAYNERETAKSIEEEISAINRNSPALINNLISNLAKLIFAILTVKQLTWILKAVLKRKIYSKWYLVYRDRNQDLWQLLLSHEDLQHQLLRSFWDNKKEVQ